MSKYKEDWYSTLLGFLAVLFLIFSFPVGVVLHQIQKDKTVPTQHLGKHYFDSVWYMGGQRYSVTVGGKRLFYGYSYKERTRLLVDTEAERPYSIVTFAARVTLIDIYVPSLSSCHGGVWDRGKAGKVQVIRVSP